MYNYTMLKRLWVWTLIATLFLGCQKNFKENSLKNKTQVILEAEHLWHFDENGTVVKNSIGKIDAICGASDCPISAVGKLEKSLYFNGNNKLSVPKSDTLNFNKNESYSIAFWVNPEYTMQKRVIVGAKLIDEEYFWIGTYKDKLKFHFLGMEDNNSMTIKPNTWTHVVFVKDSKKEKIFLYLNGVLSFTTHSSNQALIFENGLDIGHLVSEYKFKGSIDELSIYSIALYAEDMFKEESNTTVAELNSTSIVNESNGSKPMTIVTTPVPRNTPPVITLHGNATVNLKVGASYTDAGAKATDVEDGDITAKIITSNPVNTAIAGTYTISYTVKDSKNAVASPVQRVVVVHKIPVTVIKKPWEHGKLRVSDNGHMLQHTDGTGFFWMGDTAWYAPLRFDNTNIDQYLKSRQDNGMNIIQILAVQNQNYYYNTKHELPFIDANFKKPNEAYWKSIDYIIAKAAEYNIYVALLPAWNMSIGSNGGLQNESDTRTYATWIANRYKNTPNIIWVVGGDSGEKENDNWSSKEKIWNAMGESINAVVGNAQLITYHPAGMQSSSQWFSHASWLDFHMIQSGHCSTAKDGKQVLSDTYHARPTKPVVDAEPRYESIVKCFSSNAGIGHRFNAYDIREIAYTQLFAGAVGFTYGHHSIWQFWEAGETSCCSNPVKTWKDALYDEGAKQMRFVTKLMKSRPLLSRIANQSIITTYTAGEAVATKANSYAFVYLPKGGGITVMLGEISGSEVKAWWYDPRTGTASAIGSYPNSGLKVFTSPQGSQDMVLILDDVSKGYGTPGQ